ncbi:MAG: M16 family metallopeptidase [Acidobacteriota bacterium]
MHGHAHRRLARAMALLLLPALALVAAGPSGSAADRFFPYEIHERTLDNGLDVVVIPTPEFRDVLSYNTLVLAGAVNETEPGKSGLAHLFEHILFRHRLDGVDNGYNDAIDEMGAFNNAWTNNDVTFYHPLTFTRHLDRLARIEADRFARLDFTEEIFKTEAGAVLGEYRRIATDPGLRMDEVALRLGYGDHGYGHTTIGYLEDVRDMPNEYEAARQFYSDYYRPDNVVVIVSGDVDPEEIFTRVQELYGDWEASEPPPVEPSPPVQGPHREHVTWSADVPPRLIYQHRMPAHETGSVATAVGQLLPELLTSETAPLYRRLRFDKQLAATLFSSTSNYESFAARPLEITAVLYKERYAGAGMGLFDEVIADIEAELQQLGHFSERPDAAELLADLKSKYRNDLLSTLDSPGAIAQQFAWYYRFERDPEVLDTLVDSVQALTPEDIDAVARERFVPENRVIVTMAHDPDAATDTDGGQR